MDAPAETELLELTSDARHARNKLPELSHSQYTLDCPSPTRSLSKRKSLRARPTDLLEQQHAIPPLPLRTRASQPELRPRPSKMSLFSLFSKPKVEKLRGYAESGLDTPPRALSHSVAPAGRKGSIQNGEADHTRTRPTTSRSSNRASRITLKEPMPPIPPLPQLPVDHRAFEPLPLFQVWPQAIRHGTFEASMIAPEVVLQKNRQRMAATTLNLGADGSDESASVRGSAESKATVMTAFRSGSVALRSEDTSRKVFILVTSGYLLQYAETGASDRMPEKILKLGRNSAAFASDLIPGKHHVLQVSQAVDSLGGLVNDRQSIFSKLSFRNHAPRRAASNFLIVMPGAQELGEWLTAIRQEIQQQGGKMARSDSPTERRPKTGEAPKLDLQKTPSQSHRYQIKRDPQKVLSVISPLGDSFSWFPSPLESPAEDALEKQAAAEEVSPKANPESVHSRSRAPSDSPSIASSTGQSVEQQQLEKLRDSTRISHTSTAATTATNPSRTNSMTSSPPSEQVRDAVDGTSYRNLSSYSLAKRRSAVPIALKEVPTLNSPDGLLQNHRGILANPIVESPQTSPVSELAPPYGKSLSLAQSVPNLNLHAKLDRQDSKFASPISSSRERPESFLGDLPDPMTWNNKASPIHHRTSFTQQLPVRERSSSAQPRPPNSRNPSQSFSLPLRVNPIEQSKRMSSHAGKDLDVLSPIPAVHVLSAKVDPAERTTIDSAYIPGRSFSTDPRRASARLSLFPCAEPIPHQRPQSASATATLRRPTSLQVRNADQAAFLSSSRTYPTPRAVSQQRSVTTVPIRRLKPSRSLQTISPEPVPWNFSRQSSISTLVDEEDRATPLPLEQRRPSPPGRRSTSRTRTSVIPGDFAIPLGPPAPPPCAPLPEIPPPGARSRSKSPMPRNIGVAIGQARTSSAMFIRE